MEFQREIFKENFVEFNARLQGQLHLYSTVTIILAAEQCALSTSTADIGLSFCSSLLADIHSCSAALLGILLHHSEMRY